MCADGQIPNHSSHKLTFHPQEHSFPACLSNPVFISPGIAGTVFPNHTDVVSELRGFHLLQGVFKHQCFPFHHKNWISQILGPYDCLNSNFSWESVQRIASFATSRHCHQVHAQRDGMSGLKSSQLLLTGCRAALIYRSKQAEIQIKPTISPKLLQGFVFHFCLFKHTLC